MPMTDAYPPGFAWAPAFIAALGSLRTVKAAAAACGISPGTAYYLRDRNPAFAAEWQAALRAPVSVGAEGESASLPVRIYGQTDPGWRTRFLDALAETSNVTASAARAGVPVGTVYKARRQDRALAARWRKALHEGYENLEMEVLGHLRDPRQSRKMDVAAALRLLAAHRETIAGRVPRKMTRTNRPSLIRSIGSSARCASAGSPTKPCWRKTTRTPMNRGEDADELMLLEPRKRRRRLAQMTASERRKLRGHWLLWAHDGQVPPPGDWSTWLIMAGRGFGKSRAGAEWVREIARSHPGARIALVAASLQEARAVMVEGDSGLLAIASRGHRPKFEPSRRLLTWPGGAQAMLFSAAEPESLRGPQHSHAPRAGPKGILRQSSAPSGRCSAAHGRGRDRRRTACAGRGRPVLDRRTSAERRVDRAGRHDRLPPGGNLAIRGAGRGDAGLQSRHRLPGLVSRGLGHGRSDTRASGQRDDRCRSA
jgi:hypothetical protein